MAEYTTKSKSAHLNPWKKTGAPTAGFPIEFLLAFDVFPIHPEAYVCYARGHRARLPLRLRRGADTRLLHFGQHGLRHPHQVDGERDPPVLILSADMDNPRSYSDGPTRTRLESFIEIMEANRRKREKKQKANG